jgi:phage-related protein
MTQPGRAAIEIIGDASRLGAQLERDAQRAINDVDLNTDHISRQISDGFGEGVDDAITKLSELDPAVVLSSENFVNRFREAGDEVAEVFDEVDEHFRRTSRNIDRDSSRAFDQLTDAAENAGDAVQEGVIRPLSRGFTNLGSLITTAATSLAGLAATTLNPVSLALFVAQVAAFALLIPAVIGLAGALADLAGVVTVLPAAIGSLASILIVTTVAFQGFGDAISAVIKGDPDKIAEAMEKLAPAAQKVVKEFQAMLPLFRQVGDSIQQEFFEPLVGLVTQFGNRTLPALRDELDVLAQAIGRAFGHFGDLVNAGENVRILENLLASTARITDTLGAAFADLGQALFNALDAGLPSLERIADGMGGLISDFANFINESIEDGSFQAFFEDAVSTVGELVDLAGALGELFGILFTGTEDEGRDFIGTLTDLTQRLTEFFKSAEGQDAIQDFNELIQAAGSILGYVVNAIIWVLDVFKDLDDGVHATRDNFVDLWDKIVAVWNGITSAVSSAVDAIGQYFSDVWEYAQGIWDGVVETVSTAIDSVVTFFSELPGKILAFIVSIPEMVGNLFNTMIDNALTVLAAGIAAVIVIFTDGPRQIAGAFQWLWDQIVIIWDGIVQTVTNAINAVITFFQELPGKLAEIGQSIMDWATETWNTVVQTVTDAVNAVVNFVSSLPGKIASFFQQLYQSAVDKLTSLVEFVKGIPGKILTALGNVGKMLFESGKKIIQGLIDGIQDKIGALKEKIASAVQAIRDHLPFSPAKTGPLSGQGSPQIAGSVIAEMIAAGLQAGTPLIARAADAAAAAASPFGAVGQAGGAPLLPGPGAPGGGSVLSPTQTTTSGQPVFIVRIGDEDIEAFIDERVDSRVETEVRRLLAGSRGI